MIQPTSDTFMLTSRSQGRNHALAQRAAHGHQRGQAKRCSGQCREDEATERAAAEREGVQADGCAVHQGLSAAVAMYHCRQCRVTRIWNQGTTGEWTRGPECLLMCVFVEVARTQSRTCPPPGFGMTPELKMLTSATPENGGDRPGTCTAAPWRRRGRAGHEKKSSAANGRQQSQGMPALKCGLWLVPVEQRDASPCRNEAAGRPLAGCSKA